MHEIRHYIDLLTESAPLTAYHGSLDPIQERFRAFTHFGTLQAARERIREALQLGAAKPFGMGAGHHPTIYEVRLTIARPLMIEDGWLDLDDEVNGLLRLGHITPPDAKRLRDGEIDAAELFAARGYDAYSYVNTYEDAGHRTYVPFRSDQIAIVRMLDYRGF